MDHFNSPRDHMKNTLLVFIILAAIAGQLSAEQKKVWIFFKDKGPELSKVGWRQLENSLNPRTLSRRDKVTPAGIPLIDNSDRPVYPPFIKAIKQSGLEPVVISKWLNAVSVYASLEQIQMLKDLSFVKRIQPVLQGKRAPVKNSRLLKPLQSGRAFAYDYGPSLFQNELINVPQVHNMGLTGRNVLIGVFDSGFKTDFPAFEHLDIVQTRDFIYNDPIVENEDVDAPNQHNHGTSVLSLIGAYHESRLVSPAFEASFLLAKTEDVKSETQVEEDYWIAAAEWAEDLGVDIITTSLGYIDWYDPSDADGDTAPITRVADMAVKKGVVVIASAGNEGNDPWTIITPPADGDSVIAVGAVAPGGLIAGFSSRGPTADGRIKPDVVAQGLNCVLLNSNGIYSSNGAGTSYSAPQVAAAAALVLQAHPELTPMQVRQSLVNTADRFTQPDNVYGFGLIDVLEAVTFFGPVEGLADTTRFVKHYPNPFYPHQHQVFNFLVDAKEKLPLTIDIFNILGQKVDTIHETSVLGKEQIIMWNPEQLPSSGIYIYQLKLGGHISTGKFMVLR